MYSSCISLVTTNINENKIILSVHILQVKKCGYWSDISKPYRPVGDVELDTRMLLLKTLDQHDSDLMVCGWLIKYCVC